MRRTLLGIAPIGSAGFCALRLAQRLLNPVPAENCKLKTLRQDYRLPKRGAHKALGDVGTVADLFATVLRPISEQRGLETWELLAAYAVEKWFPSRIAFGKHKGRSITEARADAGLRRWLGGLAQSAKHATGGCPAGIVELGRQRRNPRFRRRFKSLPWPSFTRPLRAESLEGEIGRQDGEVGLDGLGGDETIERVGVNLRQLAAAKERGLGDGS